MGLFSSYGEAKAAKAAEKAAKQSMAFQKEQMELGRTKAGEMYGEYLPAGGLGMDALQKQYDILVGGDMEQYQESPGYQFQLEQGQQALERSQAARGGLMSGRAAKESMRFGQGLASQDFGNYLSQLSGLTQQGTGIGLQSTGGIMGQYGLGSTGGISQAYTDIGAAKGAKYRAYGSMADQAIETGASAYGGFQGGGGWQGALKGVMGSGQQGGVK